MAKGFDDIKNGLLFGAAFGVIVYYASTFTGSFLSFFAGWMTSLADLLATQSWGSFLLATGSTTAAASWVAYVLAGLFGAIVGAYIDSR